MHSESDNDEAVSDEIIEQFDSEHKVFTEDDFKSADEILEKLQMEHSLETIDELKSAMDVNEVNDLNALTDDDSIQGDRYEPNNTKDESTNAG